MRGMGLMDRLNGAKRRLWSPMNVWMVDLGSDTLVHSGGPATVVVEVRGEDDGTPERIEVYMKMVGLGYDGKRTWPLGEIPTTLGRHVLEVTLPAGLTPSCSGYADYTFEAELHRSKGVGSTAASIVDVVGRPDELYWPDGARSGRCPGPGRRRGRPQPAVPGPAELPREPRLAALSGRAYAVAS
jgi:hypothetical protein